MIPQRNLSLLSNRIAKQGERRIPETALERDYCLSWVLVGLAQSPLRDRLIFKGGTALKKCYFGDYRFSEDLDFTLGQESTWEEIREGLEIAFKKTRTASAVAVSFDREDRHSHENSYTFYLRFEGPLPSQQSKTVKVDITKKELIVLPVENRPILKGYEEYSDLTDNVLIPVYSLNEIAVEKIVALLDRARNEPRDLYDIWYLIDGGHVDLMALYDSVCEKLAFRQKSLSDVAPFFKAKETRYRRLWEIRLSAQMITLPEFDGVYRSVHRALRQAGILKR